MSDTQSQPAQPQPTLVMAGGTGGHIFPALALAKLLQQQGETVVWLGSSNSMEAQRVPATGIPFYALSISGLRGKGLKTLALAPFKLLASLWQAIKILRKVKPARVVGFGGFASGPGGLAAWLLGIPLYVHEQNALPGMTNKSLSYLARRVFTAFPQAFAGKAKVMCVGNPVREELLHLPPPAERYALREGPLRILVVGGSLGAQILNTSLPAALALLVENKCPKANWPQVHHQTGKQQLASTQALYNQNPALAAGVKVSDFIENMAEALSWADVVVCRAGALTLAELAVVGVASVLVPFPFAVDDHQTHNARFLADAGAAVLLPQPQLTATSLAALLSGPLADRQHLAVMAEKAFQLASNNAGQQMLTTILKDTP